MAVLKVAGLGSSPLDAAGDFHREWLPLAREASGQDDLVLLFEVAGREHRAWRLAAVQDLAREAAPRRVNAISGNERDAIDTTLAWLEREPGITGQLLAVEPG